MERQAESNGNCYWSMDTAAGPMKRQAGSKWRGRLSPMESATSPKETATGPMERQAGSRWRGRLSPMERQAEQLVQWRGRLSPMTGPMERQAESKDWWSYGDSCWSNV